MPAKSFSGVAAILFLVMAIAHVVRAVMGFELVVDGFTIPIYASIVAAIVLGALALVGYLVSR